MFCKVLVLFNNAPLGDSYTMVLICPSTRVASDKESEFISCLTCYKPVSRLDNGQLTEIVFSFKVRLNEKNRTEFFV